MKAAKLIVCERLGIWARALGRSLRDFNRICETRSLAECWAELALAPASVVAIELTAAVAERCLVELARMDEAFPRALFVALADRSLSRYEWLAREAGATAFAASPRRLGPIGELIRAHLARTIQDPLTIREQVIAELPWQEYTRCK